ncbi:MAG: 3-phosphoshikimate 1-carboxyvinyltransferase [bacterium]
MSVPSIKKLKGTIQMPGDKSISHRAIILGAIAEGKTRIKGFLRGEDCLNTIKIFRQLGIDIEENSPAGIVIKGKGLHGLSKPASFLDAGNSGTTLRLVSGILAGQNFTSTITGDKSLSARPMKRIIAPLREMGAVIEAREDNFAPLVITGGELKGINYVSQVASAQVKSCLLLAGLYSRGETTVTEPVKSRDHTERMLKYFGIEIKEKGLTVGVKNPARLTGQAITVPGDISSAAFFVIGAILLPDSRITIKNIGLNPTRTGILTVLKQMGAKIIIENEKTDGDEPVGDLIVKAGALKGVKITGGLIPFLIDEIPILAVAATQAEGATEISGAGELRVKETDRIKAISSQLALMGARIEEKEDGMIIYGGTRLKGGCVNSFGDHRMAMSLVIAGLLAEGKTTVKNTECISTSLPGFMDILKQISA